MQHSCGRSIGYDVGFQNVSAVLVDESVERQEMQLAVRNDDQSRFRFLSNSRLKHQREQLFACVDINLSGPDACEIIVYKILNCLPARWKHDTRRIRASDSQTIRLRFTKHKLQHHLVRSQRCLNGPEWNWFTPIRW